jgi:predicted N-acetyltransferase YhbS
MIEYTIEKNLSPEEFKQVLVNSTLGERRPVDDQNRMKAMVEAADLIITARHNGQLVGVARSLTDFVYCTYLSDLAVDEKYQHQGIGKELIRQTKMATPEAILILLSAPKATEYYPKIGMQRHEHCFLIKEVDELK